MFKANAPQLNTKRQQLRETLRQRFANMQRTGCSLTCRGCHTYGDSSPVMNGSVGSLTNDAKTEVGCSKKMVAHINNLTLK